MDSWRHKELFKGPMHKFSFAATYLGLWKRGVGRVGYRCLRRDWGRKLWGEC